MSTDFCMETLLAGLNTSDTSLNSSKNYPISNNQEKSSSNPTPSSPGANMVSENSEKRETKKKGTKRKRDDGEDHGRSTSSEGKKKRVRTAYTSVQLHTLETIYSQTQYPDMLTRQNIAEQMGLEERRIHVWFQNRRAKHRKHGASGTTVTPALPLPMYNPAMLSAHLSHSVPVSSHQPNSAFPASVNKRVHQITPPVSKISPPVSHLPAYYPLRNPMCRPATMPMIQSVHTTAVSAPYHPVAVTRDGTTSPQQQSVQPTYNPFDFIRMLPPTMMPSTVKSTSPEQLKFSSNSPHPQSASSHIGLITHNETTPPLSLRPSTVHLLRRSCSPELTRSTSVSPQAATPTLSHYLRTPSPQLNIAMSPLQMTPSHHIENYSSDIVVIPASYGSQTVVDYRLCNSGSSVNSFHVL